MESLQLLWHTKKTSTIKYHLSGQNDVNKITTSGLAVPLDIFSIFSNQEHLDLLKIIAGKWNDMRLNVTPQFLMDRLHLSKRELNSRIEKLMTIGCIDMINGAYSLTSLGEEIYEGLFAIEYAISTYNELEKEDDIRSTVPHASNDLKGVIQICMRKISRGFAKLPHALT